MNNHFSPAIKENLFALFVTPLQIVPKLTTAVVAELERILDNKPVRPPMISTLAMR
jgi:hypothetical protein